MMKKREVLNTIKEKIYRFGDGKLFTAIENVDIPIVLSNKTVTDIVNSDIPLYCPKGH